MTPLSLFIHTPLGASVKRAIGAIEEAKIFSPHLVHLDQDYLTLLIEARPCICVFSIDDMSSCREVCNFLQKLKDLRVSRGENPRDSTLRLVFVAEDRSIPIERWQPIGVHEFIFAPISPKALAYKLERHHYKAVTSEPVSEQPKALSSRQKGPAQLPRPREYKMVKKGESGKLRATYVPGSDYVTIASDRLPLQKFVISATATQFRAPPGGTWKIDSNGKGFEDQWIYSNEDPTQAKPSGASAQSKWVFTGDKPQFDPEKKSWIFKGESPQLVLVRPGTEGEAVIQTSDSSPASVVVEQSEKFRATDIRIQVFPSLREEKEEGTADQVTPENASARENAALPRVASVEPRPAEDLTVKVKAAEIASPISSHLTIAASEGPAKIFVSTPSARLSTGPGAASEELARWVARMNEELRLKKASHSSFESDKVTSVKGPSSSVDESEARIGGITRNQRPAASNDAAMRPTEPAAQATNSEKTGKTAKKPAAGTERNPAGANVKPGGSVHPSTNPKPETTSRSGALDEQASSTPRDGVGVAPQSQSGRGASPRKFGDGEAKAQPSDLRARAQGTQENQSATAFSNHALSDESINLGASTKHESTREAKTIGGDTSDEGAVRIKKGEEHSSAWAIQNFDEFSRKKRAKKNDRPDSEMPSALAKGGQKNALGPEAAEKQLPTLDLDAAPPPAEAGLGARIWKKVRDFFFGRAS